ncbi:hypothetical protein LCGC14_2189980, partial [marine sediment metagenome]
MRLSTIVWRELRRRKAKLCISLAAVALAVGGFVCVTTTSESWERAIQRQLQSVGPNVFLLPRAIPVSAFHRIEFSMPQMPEYYFTKLRREGILQQGLAAPTLLFTTRLKGRNVVLRGWSEEFPLVGAAPVPPFAPGEVVLGAEAAERLALGVGDVLAIKGRSLRVRAVRPKLGAASDKEVICDLRELQEMLGVKGRFTMIEVIVTDQGQSDRLARALPTLLPDVRRITRRAIIRTQWETFSTARRYSFLLVGLIALAAALGIALQTVTNVRERRREVGTLMAVGASTWQILGLFVHKALL